MDPRTTNALAEVHLERGVTVHVQELLARRLVRLVSARQLEPVESYPSAPPGAHVDRDALGLHPGHDVRALRTLDYAGLAPTR